MDTATIDWSMPYPVSDVEVAFPANALDYMPSEEECEAGLDALPAEEREGWLKFQRVWFFRGLSRDAQIDLKDGVDGRMAFRHLAVIQGSFAPRHEHKEAAVAYLCSLWFSAIENYEPPRKDIT